MKGEGRRAREFFWGSLPNFFLSENDGHSPAALDVLVGEFFVHEVSQNHDCWIDNFLIDAFYDLDSWAPFFERPACKELKELLAQVAVGLHIIRVFGVDGF